MRRSRDHVRGFVPEVLQAWVDDTLAGGALQERGTYHSPQMGMNPPLDHTTPPAVST